MQAGFYTLEKQPEKMYIYAYSTAWKYERKNTMSWIVTQTNVHFKRSNDMQWNWNSLMRALTTKSLRHRQHKYQNNEAIFGKPV